MAKIIIKWNALFVGSACKFDVYLMNTYIGELRCGRTIETTVDPGCYTLFFKPKSIIFRKDATSFTVVVNDEAEIVKLKTKFDFNGKFVITYADNAPHVPKNFANNINSTNEIHQTLTDIKHETKKTNGCLSGCLTFIIVMFSIGFIFSLVFREAITPDVTTSLEQTSEGSSQEDQDNASTQDNILYSDDKFKISFVNLVDPKSGLTMYNMNLKLENNSDKNVIIYLSEAYVNDTAITFLGGNADFEGTAPGKQAICAFMFGYANHDINSIEDIKKIEFKISLKNSDNYSDELLSTDTVTLNFN